MLNMYCKDQIWIPGPLHGWTKAQKTQNNKFVENGLENWVLVNQTTTKVDLDDKRIKIDKFKLKKIVLSTIRRDQLLYIDPQVWEREKYYNNQEQNL